MKVTTQPHPSRNGGYAIPVSNNRDRRGGYFVGLFGTGITAAERLGIDRAA
ncbi:hypothetical protein IU459_34330 [Nocardia amamiensis]|uniref:Uncharacterized protein n=1 Tax=Nocardia amamiensis TaxID=404578 RepID=A0ABS0D632_9NOCA|nr:hypothetical protein [Nocardia amamiensis]MBF6302578.1 hypothetical protein [Nocardia amamiensis]